MRKRKILLLIPLALLLFSGIYLLAHKLQTKEDTSIPNIAKQTEEHIPEPKPEPIPLEQQILAKMSIEEKVGKENCLIKVENNLDDMIEYLKELNVSNKHHTITGLVGYTSRISSYKYREHPNQYTWSRRYN